MYPALTGEWNLRTDRDGRFVTPRGLLSYHFHQASAKALGRKLASDGMGRLDG